MPLTTAPAAPSGTGLPGDSRDDLSRLAVALEYADLAAALYLAGGSDHAALLLAAGSEQQLGELFRLNASRPSAASVADLLQRLSQRRLSAPTFDVRGHAQARGAQPALARIGAMSDLPDNKARHDTAGLLRAAWYLLESLGLEAVAPKRLRQAIERSTIHSHDGA